MVKLHTSHAVSMYILAASTSRRTSPHSLAGARTMEVGYSSMTSLKNFSLIEKDGEYRLSPAYDLVNTSLQIREPQIFALKNGLFKEGMNKADTHNIGYEDFVEFGRRIGLNDRVIKQELKMFQEPDLKAIHLIEKSFLSEELKKQYIVSYKYRCKMLTF